MSKTRGKSNAHLNDGLNEEQDRKRDSIKERVDPNGIVIRQHVTGQTVFDVMMVRGMIERPQHEAAHIFIEALSMSGSNIPSIPLERIESGKSRVAQARDAAERRMIFSGAYRYMQTGVDEGQCKVLMSLCNSPYDMERVKGKVKDISDIVSEPLWRLAKFYNINSRRDPRRIIKSQLYFKS